MFICLKTKNTVSSGMTPLVRLVSSIQSQRYNWKGDISIFVPMIWEFKVLGATCTTWRSAKTALAVWRKRELLLLAVCCISSLLTLWLVSGNWGWKTGTAQEEVTAFVKPVSLTWLSLLRAAVLTVHFRKFQFYKSAFCTSFICSL